MPASPTLPALSALSATTKELVICVPGPWRGRAHLMQRLLCAEPSGRFDFVGDRLRDVLEPSDAAPVRLQLLARDEAL